MLLQKFADFLGAFKFKQADNVDEFNRRNFLTVVVVENLECIFKLIAWIWVFISKSEHKLDELYEGDRTTSVHVTSFHQIVKLLL